MREKIYDDRNLVIFKDGSKFYIRYDAGSHQIAIREDEISDKEALQIVKSPEEATRVLFALQKRLTLSGINPYVSNVRL
ncbi:MAG: hypothetical protein ACOYXR_08395 [Nitrospirota bacterium]